MDGLCSEPSYSLLPEMPEIAGSPIESRSPFSGYGVKTTQGHSKHMVRVAFRMVPAFLHTRACHAGGLLLGSGNLGLSASARRSHLVA